MPVTTARQKVLVYLKKNRAVSAAQIGRALKMSAANVRHHLSVLCSDGRVSIIGETRKDGRGRPVKLYGLSESLLGNNLAFLADELLEEFLEKLPPARQVEALQSLGHRMALTNKVSEVLGISKRLAQTIENLNQLNYQARWEAGAEGPRILFGHCPYAAIIEKHPELCQMDAELLNTYMDEPARQSAKIKRDGSPVCIFLLGQL
jgi:predicted ArsR family transcriptional regulator